MESIRRQHRRIVSQPAQGLGLLDGQILRRGLEGLEALRVPAGVLYLAQHAQKTHEVGQGIDVVRLQSEEPLSQVDGLRQTSVMKAGLGPIVVSRGEQGSAFEQLLRDLAGLGETPLSQQRADLVVHGQAFQAVRAAEPEPGDFLMDERLETGKQPSGCLRFLIGRIAGQSLMSHGQRQGKPAVLKVSGREHERQVLILRAESKEPLTAVLIGVSVVEVHGRFDESPQDLLLLRKGAVKVLEQVAGLRPAPARHQGMRLIESVAQAPADGRGASCTASLLLHGGILLLRRLANHRLRLRLYPLFVRRRAWPKKKCLELSSPNNSSS